MPLIPERLASRQAVKASIGSQFWEQPVHSSKSVDGQLWSLPCEPPALNLTGSSGLSRTQQLLAAQAVRVPFLPSYDGSSDGLVLDRVLAKAGGRRWWGTLGGRVKAQRAYRLAARGDISKLEAVRDLGNYALCARSRIQLGRRLTLNGVVEAPDAHKLQTRLAERWAEQRQAAPTAAAPVATDGDIAAAAPSGSSGGLGRGSSRGAGSGPIPELEPCTAHATLRYALPGHDLSATAGYNLQYADSTGDVAHVPLAVSLDLASHDRQDGLQYRVGLHQVTAPLTELPPKSGVRERWRTSLHAQGALAVEGEAHIWKAAGSSAASSSSSASSSQLAADAPFGAAAPKQQQQAKGSGEEAAAAEEPRRSKLASAIATAAAAEDEPQAAGSSGSSRAAAASGEQQPGPAASQPAAAAAPAEAPAATPAAGAGQAGSSPRLPVPSLEEFIKPLEHLGEQMGEMLHHATHPHDAQQAQRQQHQQGGGGKEGPSNVAATGISSSGAASSSSLARPARLLGLSPDTISATLQDSVALLQQVRESVGRLTGNVQDGSLQRLSQQLADSRGTPQRRRPYSMLLAQPHLKLNAALGCLARMPLPALRTFSFPHASLEPLDPTGSGSGAHTSGVAAGGRQASTSSLVSRASHSSNLAEQWQPYFKGTALRVFGSAGVSGQLGRFTRPWLDYTAASARIDVGLTSPHVVGVVPDPSALAADSSHRPDKQRAFALEGRGAWHALSVSLAQQVLGPLRARVDARFALDPTSVPVSEGERSTLKGVLQTALSVRPSLLETVYGCDVVLPGTEGAARLVVWYSPKRRECMAELRLF